MAFAHQVNAGINKELLESIQIPSQDSTEVHSSSLLYSVIFTTVICLSPGCVLQQAAGGEDDQAGLLGLHLRQQGGAPRHPRDPHRLPPYDRHQVTWSLP